MIACERWRDNWRVVAGDGALRVELPRSRRGWGTLVERVRRLPAGAPVVVAADGRGAARRCRAFAAESGIVPERTYVAIPSAAAPAYLVEDAPAALRAFLRVVVPPPGRTLRSRLAEPCLAALRALDVGRPLRALACSRVLVARRA